KGALDLLDKARLLTERGRPYLPEGARLPARATTLNNLGCLMKRWGKPRVGISYLSRAIDIEARSPPGMTDNPAGTHLNMCAALSDIGLHRSAAYHAAAAVHLLTSCSESAATLAVAWPGSPPTLVGGGAEEGDGEGGGRAEEDESWSMNCGSAHHNQERSGEESLPLGEQALGKGGTATNEPHTVDDAKGVRGSAEAGDSGGEGSGEAGGGGVTLEASAGTLLAMAHFNLAVELEHLRRHEAALASYALAIKAAEAGLGPRHPVALGMREALEQAKADIGALAAGHAARSSTRTAKGRVTAHCPHIGKLRLSYRN
ncbi:unnamed protein product, partial [Discosporangium mesarthrocarpum]